MALARVLITRNVMRVICAMSRHREWKDYKYSIDDYLKKKKIPNLFSIVKKLTPGKEVFWILITLAVTGLAVFMVIWFFVVPNL
ncbi:MAG: hypothetical protein QNL11_12660 [Desulfobacterales bacterium]|jgi:hypothetical protein|nr:hypothetical protein [Desulfobacterales bacterium]